MTTAVELLSYPGDEIQEQSRALVWRFDSAHESISSASVGGGWNTIEWITNIGVTREYRRTDLADHGAQVASELNLAGPGCVLLTAADISRRQVAELDEVRCDATVGISKPTWAADADDAYTLWRPGTINTVIQVPVAFEPGAAVNAVMTATEAKTQALIEADVPGTGTASDAVVICWPHAAPIERFCGPRSVWGARLARATHQAVAAGITAAQI